MLKFSNIYFLLKKKKVCRKNKEYFEISNFFTCGIIYLFIYLFDKHVLKLPFYYDAKTEVQKPWIIFNLWTN
jgi:hypothetical protein